MMCVCGEVTGKKTRGNRELAAVIMGYNNMYESLRAAPTGMIE
jgi:hypothetical protein